MSVPCRYCGKPTPLLGNMECEPCYKLSGLINENAEVARKMLDETDRAANRVWFDLIQSYETRGVYHLKEGTAADSPVAQQIAGETEVLIFLRRCSGPKTFAIKVNREVADFFMKP